MATSTQYRFLERDPHSVYEQLSIKGRRIKARTIYGQHVNAEEPRTVEQLAKDWDLPIAAIEEAIAYCRSNPPEILRDFEREEALMVASGMNEPGYKFNPKPRPLTPQQRAEIRRRFR